MTDLGPFQKYNLPDNLKFILEENVSFDSHEVRCRAYSDYNTNQGERLLNYSSGTICHENKEYTIHLYIIQDGIHVCRKCDRLDTEPPLTEMSVSEALNSGFMDDRGDFHMARSVTLKYIRDVPLPEDVLYGEIQNCTFMYTNALANIQRLKTICQNKPEYAHCEAQDVVSYLTQISTILGTKKKAREEAILQEQLKVEQLARRMEEEKKLKITIAEEKAKIELQVQSIEAMKKKQIEEVEKLAALSAALTISTAKLNGEQEKLINLHKV